MQGYDLSDNIPSLNPVYNSVTIQIYFTIFSPTIYLAIDFINITSTYSSFIALTSECAVSGRDHRLDWQDNKDDTYQLK